jgi:hypothetical protein
MNENPELLTNDELQKATDEYIDSPGLGNKYDLLRIVAKHQYEKDARFLNDYRFAMTKLIRLHNEEIKKLNGKVVEETLEKVKTILTNYSSSGGITSSGSKYYVFCGKNVEQWIKEIQEVEIKKEK